MNASDSELESYVGIGAYLEGQCLRLIVAGLVLEVFLPLLPLSPFPERIGVVLANALVAFGVWAEFRFGRWASSAQEDVTRRSNERLAAAVREAGEAKERASQLELELEKEHVARLQLERRIADRELSPEQIRIITAAVVTAPCFVGVIAAADRESRKFGRQVAETLHRALAPVGFGAYFSDGVPVIPASAVQVGIRIRPKGTIFAKAFAEADIPFTDDPPPVSDGPKFKPPAGSIPLFPEGTPVIDVGLRA